MVKWLDGSIALGRGIPRESWTISRETKRHRYLVEQADGVGVPGKIDGERKTRR